jgi:predicted tellurium resistance membrane protein TerC
MGHKFDDLSEKEQRQVVSIGCLYLIVLALVILTIIFSFLEKWGAAVGLGLLAFVIWMGIKFIYGDEWNV